jgi:hypothetical protein
MVLVVSVAMIVTALIVAQILKAVVARIDRENDKRKQYGTEEGNEED